MKTAAIVLLAGLLLALVGAGWWAWTPDRSRSELEAKYLAAPGDLVEVAGTRLHVRDNGPRNAPAVILLHGFGSSLHTWEPWAAALSPTYRVIRFDMPGAGLSDPDATGDYSDARALQLLGALMDSLGLARASLVGHSMGGRIAWEFAAAFPGRVEKLVLVAPDGFASPGMQYGQHTKVPALARVMRYVLPKPLLRANLVHAYADPARLTDATVTRYHDLLLAPGVRDAILARTAQLVLSDPAPQLRRITAPTLLLWGQADAMIPVANAQDYLALIAGSRAVVLPGLGHVPHEELPAESLEPVRAFLAE